MKWKNVEWDGDVVYITLENGKRYRGEIYHNDRFVDFGDFDDHSIACKAIFGSYFNLSEKDSKILSALLGMDIRTGYCPESNNPKEFINRFYEIIGKTDFDVFKEL